MTEIDQQPPPLTNDCFALPPGQHWTPVAEAHALLQTRLSVIAGTETLPISQALGRVLAKPVAARRDNPPTPNAAMDGYAFDGGDQPAGTRVMPLVNGRSAAGQPFDGVVPQGHAVRVLTGASMPKGTNTVIMQEDVQLRDGEIAFQGPIKAGSNARDAGEDAKEAQEILPSGRIVTPADLAFMAATAVQTVTVRHRLKVAVISTGDELVEAGQNASGDQIFDANRPMLLAMLARFGYQPVDLGRVPDNRDALQDAFDQAAKKADVILTSGGASAGDEDHVSALLKDTGSMTLWRMALKPGRPLVLAMWQQTPVFGLPGNPVAAMVCALMFARPAMGVLSGQGWSLPTGLMLPAHFSKIKKAGRREYLRARLREGRVEVFESEGSGRVSSLSWAEGLVELPDETIQIVPGTPVRYLPFSDFGL
ncbi:molybdopterin-binding protein [Cognatishimia sp. WU-CL00825]|uniref:molybdenum cofactor synthesis domain-containing protein n=1 Tax=Cognatishimia sp. WU-CL00825 TaxID=3127658 RepID=UPI003108EA78